MRFSAQHVMRTRADRVSKGDDERRQYRGRIGFGMWIDQADDIASQTVERLRVQFRFRVGVPTRHP